MNFNSTPKTLTNEAALLSIANTLNIISSTINTICISTPIGNMRATANQAALLSLEFIKPTELANVAYSQPNPSSRNNKIIYSIQQELQDYFSGALKTFKTPIQFTGSNFQCLTWQQLQNIPYGATWSYKQQATAMNMPTAFRAVANANGANRLAIIIPCHRVINSNGNLGGYAAGTNRKKWLLEHEQKSYFKI